MRETGSERERERVREEAGQIKGEMGGNIARGNARTRGARLCGFAIGPLEQ